MTRTFVILLIVAALLFIGFYFAITLYNRFISGAAIGLIGFHALSLAGSAATIVPRR